MKFREALEIVLQHTKPLPRDVADVKNWTSERTKKVEDAIKRCKQYLYKIPVDKQ